MKTMKWLIQREYWENKGMLFWAPAVVGGLMVAFSALMLIVGKTMEAKFNGDSLQHFHDLSAAERHDMASAFGAAFPMMGTPLYIMMGFLIFFYCLGALYDDRRDRSGRRRPTAARPMPARRRCTRRQPSSRAA